MKPGETIEQELLALRADYAHRIEAIDVDIHHKVEPVEKDFAEQAGQRENDDVLVALDDDARQTVIQIDHALQRIKAGTYGLCTKCGQPISVARLKAVPFAESCVECAEEAD